PVGSNECPAASAPRPRARAGRAGATGASHRRGSMETATLASDRHADDRPEPGPRLSVVIPTRNEAGNVRQLFAELRLALADIEHEVIVVDDSSDEITRRELREIAARAPTWSVSERPAAEQTGLATAVARGMEAATGRAICVMDGDLQHPPAVVP